ncbi:hypothetical protein [Periweissella fabalis]|uniref:Uncharacterized protein n=1 Tax=Periweissella fabalis TaxID=1070421 RepID=A0A7X6N2C1_9LACO|nr:hypothetical protein [Periweissella fabalis]MCM0599133.1 hypothetical protein [Periweissella fabalis]NKZ23412.1 hypothetical protein [Periweissella fabalis]
MNDERRLAVFGFKQMTASELLTTQLHELIDQIQIHDLTEDEQALAAWFDEA